MELLRMVESGVDEAVGGAEEGGPLLDERREMLRAKTALLLAGRQYYEDLGSKVRAEASKEEHSDDEEKAKGDTALAVSKLECEVQKRLLGDEEYIKLRVEAAKSALKRDIARNDDQAKRVGNEARSPAGDRRQPRRSHGGGERGGAMAPIAPSMHGAAPTPHTAPTGTATPAVAVP